MPITKTFPKGIKVHGFQTGTVAVKKEHFKYSGWGFLRAAQILWGKTFMPPMPIWAWAIETPHGNLLIDTGETTDFFRDEHFKNASDKFVNRTILRIQVEESQHIDRQLEEVGLSVDKIDAVAMTHLHIDHTDGMRFFPNREFFVSRYDVEKPFGAPLSTFPSWFAPKKIDHPPTSFPFRGAHHLSDSITLLSTPGHTMGHQSVLLDTGDHMVLFAGDTTFNEAQLVNHQIGGICISLTSARQSLKNIQQLSREVELVYLPSHDPESGTRLMNLKTTRVKLNQG